MKNNSLQEEMVKTFEIYEKVLEFFSSTFNQDIYFSEVSNYILKKTRERFLLSEKVDVNSEILSRELFTREKTAEKFDFFLKKVKESEVSIEAAYSLIFGLENSILEKLKPVEEVITPSLNKIIKETEEVIKYLRENSKLFNLTFL